MKINRKFDWLKVGIIICFVVFVSTACRHFVRNTESLLDETVSVMETDTSHLSTQINEQYQIDHVQQEAISDLSTQMPSWIAGATTSPSPLPLMITSTPYPVCTPPACSPDEMYHCPGDCPGGCGTTCATATPGKSSGIGQVWGEICFPAENIPAMTLYFQDISTQQILEFSLAEGQDSYQLEIPAGVCIAFAWLLNEDLGGGYSQFHLCNPNISSCADHNLVPFLVQENHVVVGVDICDWDTENIKFPKHEE